jgi:hypothetical protein
VTGQRRHPGDADVEELGGRVGAGVVEPDEGHGQDGGDHDPVELHVDEAREPGDLDVAAEGEDGTQLRPAQEANGGALQVRQAGGHDDDRDHHLLGDQRVGHAAEAAVVHHGEDETGRPRQVAGDPRLTGEAKALVGLEERRDHARDQVDGDEHAEGPDEEDRPRPVRQG